MYDRRVMGGRWEEEEGARREPPYMDEQEQDYQRVVMMKPREDPKEEEAPKAVRKREKVDASGSESEVTVSSHSLSLTV